MRVEKEWDKSRTSKVSGMRTQTNYTTESLSVKLR